jgi:CRP-like cAMP-binding protein
MLPDSELTFVSSALAPVTLEQQRTLYGPQDPIDYIYFMDTGVVSLLAVGQDGRAIETGAIGQDGIVGAHLLLGAERAGVQALLQTDGTAQRMPAALFTRAVDELPAFRKLVLRWLNFQLYQAQQYALCHALHSIEARFCRWLLQACDARGSDGLEITQELCAHMLGVQRTSLSMVAHALQTAGTIRTLRGKIQIFERPRLEEAACECYAKLKRHSAAHRDLAARSLPLDLRRDEGGRENGSPRPATYAG